MTVLPVITAAAAAALVVPAAAQAATVSVPKTAKVTEGKVVSVKVKLAKKAARTVKVKWSLPKGSAFKTRRGTVRIKKGARSATLRLTALQDKLVNGNRNVTLKVGARKVALTLVDDDTSPSTPQPQPTATPAATTTPQPLPQPTATAEPTPAPAPAKISAVDLQRSENAATRPTIVLEAPSTVPVKVHWETVDGTATAGSDFSKASGNATFQPGDTSVELQVGVANDLAHEQSEAFTIKLSSPVDGVIVDDEATITIADDDPHPAISVLDTLGEEADTSMVFEVKLDRPSFEPVTVKATTIAGGAGGGKTCTDGVDFIGLSAQVVTFAPGQTSKSVPVQLCDDNLQEPDETVKLTLHQPSSSGILDGDGVGTITDDD